MAMGVHRFPAVRRLCLLAVLAIGFGSGAPRAEAFRPPHYGGDVTAAQPSGLRTLDPVAMERLGEWQLALLVYDGLFRQLRQGQEPQMQLAAASQTTGAGKRRVVITVRKGVRSHQGRQVGAADVVASLRRLAATRTGWLLGCVSRVRHLDLHRVELTCARVCPELHAVLAAPQASILPRGLPPGPRPDGTGAFRHVRGGLDGPMLLSANAEHFAGRPFLDSLTLVSYPRHRDEISAFYLERSLVSFQGTRLFGRSPEFATRAMESPAVSTVALLVGKEGAVIDRRVRQAIYLALDKHRLRLLGTGAPTTSAHGPVPPVLLGRRARSKAANPAPHSPSKARALLTAAQGSPVVAARRGQDGAIAVTLLVDQSRHRDMDVARKIMTDLAAVGLRVTITSTEPGPMERLRLGGRFELALHRFTSPVLQSRYHLAAAYAAAGDLAQATRVVRDLHARVAQRTRDFMGEFPLIPLYHTGLRADVSAALPQVRQGPWGLLDWASAQRK